MQITTRRRYENMKNLIYRLGIYIIGVISVSLGIVLCVKCELGVSPISSIPYVLGYLTPLTFGTLTMLFHFCNSMIQYILEKKQSPSSINPYLHFSTYCAIIKTQKEQPPARGWPILKR